MYSPSFYKNILADIYISYNVVIVHFYIRE
jgi:hypothetical protein